MGINGIGQSSAQNYQKQAVSAQKLALVDDIQKQREMADRLRRMSGGGGGSTSNRGFGSAYKSFGTFMTFKWSIFTTNYLMDLTKQFTNSRNIQNAIAEASNYANNILSGITSQSRPLTNMLAPAMNPLTNIFKLPVNLSRTLAAQLSNLNQTLTNPKSNLLTKLLELYQGSKQIKNNEEIDAERKAQKTENEEQKLGTTNPMYYISGAESKNNDSSGHTNPVMRSVQKSYSNIIDFIFNA